MSQQDEEIPQVVINGLDAIARIQKVVSKQIEFSYQDLDQADDLRQAIQVIQNELAQYNQILRQSKQQQQKQQAEEKAKAEEVEADEEPKLESVKEDE